MIPRIAVAVLAPLVLVLGPHLFLVLAFTAVLAVVLVFLWRIDQLTMSTGWGVVPVRRLRL